MTRFPVRLEAGVTSVSIRPQILALYATVINIPRKKVNDMLHQRVTNILKDGWDKTSGKGMSDYVTQELIREILEKPDFKKYQSNLLEICNERQTEST